MPRNYTKMEELAGESCGLTRRQIERWVKRMFRLYVNSLCS